MPGLLGTKAASDLGKGKSSGMAGMAGKGKDAAKGSQGMAGKGKAQAVAVYTGAPGKGKGNNGYSYAAQTSPTMPQGMSGTMPLGAISASQHRLSTINASSRQVVAANLFTMLLLHESECKVPFRGLGLHAHQDLQLLVEGPERMRQGRCLQLCAWCAGVAPVLN